MTLSYIDKRSIEDKTKTNIISFCAGPTHISDHTLQLIKEITDSGFLSTSHRSKEFTEVSKKAIEGMRKQMKIPKDYHIFYQNSSTIAWDTILQNAVKNHSFHFVCGEFSKRFYETAQQILPTATQFFQTYGEAVEWRNANVPASAELIAITHNDTREGIMWPWEDMRELRDKYPDKLFAIDVCSSFGGMEMDWTLGDFWLGSVQKCLAMPTGMGYLIVSPKGFETAQKLNKKIPAWHRFSIMEEQMKVYQTYETPNLLEIALLARLMENWDLKKIEKETRAKAAFLYSADLPWTPFVKDPKWQSITSLVFRVDDANQWRQKALQSRFDLGHAYGDLGNKLVRICNFSSHTPEMMAALVNVLR